MHDGTVLDLAFEYRTAPDRHDFGKRMMSIALACAAAAALLIGAGVVLRIAGTVGANEPAVRLRLDELQAVSTMTVDDKSQILVAGATAQERNAAIPIAGAGEVAHQFRLGAAIAGAYPTALRCLTQAVYYEAAVEPMQGRRAVAQVVLNRMRHPAYPKSVCGVVYQGSERRTGCQFSFTCDGSLLRVPAAGAWREAESVARAALAGYVERSVGTATHYHADYVLPKWAFNLAKIAQLNRHIFYRFHGGWGKSAAFAGRYSGAEHIPAINFLALKARAMEDGGVPGSEAFVSGLTVAPHVTDRHAETDIGGRIDMTKEWRLTIPDPVQASSRYREAIGVETAAPAQRAETGSTAMVGGQP